MSGHEDNHDRHGSAVHVTVRTPAGISHTFTFKSDDLVIQATSEAMEHFVSHGQLAVGDYDLTLVRSALSTDLADTEPLGEYGIHDGDVLHLVPEAPQVDG